MADQNSPITTHIEARSVFNDLIRSGAGRGLRPPLMREVLRLAIPSAILSYPPGQLSIVTVQVVVNFAFGMTEFKDLSPKDAWDFISNRLVATALAERDERVYRLLEQPAGKPLPPQDALTPDDPTVTVDSKALEAFLPALSGSPMEWPAPQAEGLLQDDVPDPIVAARPSAPPPRSASAREAAESEEVHHS